jgi:uncharacterized SAM-binding protein YcdF (DUF218 family)
MSLDAPHKNKMMQAAPAKKGFHFASDGIHLAEFIEAASIEEAAEIYQRIKRPIIIFTGGTEQQSTADSAKPEEKAVQ